MSARARRALAIVLMLVALVGVPIFLVLTVAWPLPDVVDAVRRGGIPEDTFVSKALALALWLLWADLVICMAVEWHAARTAVSPPRLLIGGPLQWAAAWLVAAALLNPARSDSGTEPPQRTPLALALASQEIAETEIMAETVVAVPDVPTHVPSSQSATKQVIVKPRDTLWGLAEEHLGK